LPAADGGELEGRKLVATRTLLAAKAGKILRDLQFDLRHDPLVQ
jgi:hypothetical protein